MRNVEALAASVDAIKIDRRSVPQERLDLATRPRTSVFPWRGQFSPGLVEVLLEGRLSSGATLLDPFAGSGTSLLEGARMGLRCVGSEVNPAAWALARFAGLSTLALPARRKLLSVCASLLEPFAASLEGAPALFSPSARSESIDGVFALVRSLPSDQRSVLTVTTLMAMGNGPALTAEGLASAFRRVSGALLDLPRAEHAIDMLLCDGRKLPLESGSVDGVVTSPPYINVFNYHQNYRPAAERLGWRPLDIAPSEVGSNRKHRGNRFLTVVQYAMDMLSALQEMRRLLSRKGFAVVVIGRESNVRGVSFQNGRLLAMLAVGGAAFRISRWQERSFISRFGGRIFEDILTLEPDQAGATALADFGRAVGTFMLRSATCADADVRADIDSAIKGAPAVEPSPILASRDGFGEWEATAPSQRRRRKQAAP